MNPKCLRLHFRHTPKGIVNVDVTLNEGRDLYEVKAYQLKNHGLDVQTILDQQDIFVDALPETIREAIGE